MKDNLITVITFIYPHEANIAKSYLEAFGINVLIKDELTVQVHNFYSNAIGGVKLLVEQSQVKEAIQLLKDADYLKENTETQYKIEKTTDVFPKLNKSICPYCESSNVIKIKSPAIILVLSILLLGFPLPFIKKKYHCYDCEKEWLVKNKKTL